MTNLIPLHLKKEVRTEYKIRLISAFILVLTFVLIVIGALLIPTYYLLTLQTKALFIEEEKKPQQGEVYEHYVSQIKKANTYITQLAQEDRTPLPSDILDHIIAADTDAITINAINYTQKEQGDELSLVGVADTRSELVAFVDRLKNDAFFETASVPISDLAPEKDLPFRLQIELVKEVSTTS